jgi:hypothetical protein
MKRFVFVGLSLAIAIVLALFCLFFLAYSFDPMYDDNPPKVRIEPALPWLSNDFRSDKSEYAY